MDHAFYKFNGRLAMFQRSSADKEHWEGRWSKNNVGHILDSYRSGRLDEFEGMFTRHLPKELPVLEAGCGMGQWVMALSARGYRVEGLDYAERAIQRIREHAPELKVRTGDIYKLDAPDETYGGYISIGLFEHNPAGPRAALLETRRVLHSEGVALISVPYLNRRRSRLLERGLSANGSAADGLAFYQYYFSLAEFQRHIEEAGLTVVECYPYGLHTGLTRDSRFWQRLSKSPLFVWPLQYRFIRWCANAPGWIRFRAAHMLMFACRRADGVRC
ncbi:MAG TPA: class I SAM-dependent methyltransferase [Verrucomicrobiae bacterium]